jgi:hypothetical protein
VNLEFFIQLKILDKHTLSYDHSKLKLFFVALSLPSKSHSGFSSSFIILAVRTNNFIVPNGCCTFGNQCLFSDTCTHTWPQMSQPRWPQSELLLSCKLSNLMLNINISNMLKFGSLTASMPTLN